MSIDKTTGTDNPNARNGYECRGCLTCRRAASLRYAQRRKDQQHGR